MPIDKKNTLATVSVSQSEWDHTRCDRYDYLSAVFCGAAAGLIDVFFVGMPGKSKLGTLTDGAADELVKKFARLSGWKPKDGQTNTIASAIGFLERKYPVNYDQRSSVDVNNRFPLSTRNHHYKSLAHAPDLIGLFFSILDQFRLTSTFIHDGKIIRIDTQDKQTPLKGSNFIAKLFCGFCNWLGHIMSDMAGSSGSRGSSKNGRGTGVCVPFMELFQLCNFGSFQVEKDRQDFAIIMTRVFQEGYDARHGAAAAVPVMIAELMIRVFWIIRQRFFRKQPWEKCMPTKNNSDLRIMLLVGNATLCLIDGADAAIHGAAEGGNPITVILHLNLIAWVHLAALVFEELKIDFGPQIMAAFTRFERDIICGFTYNEQREISLYCARMHQLDCSLQQDWIKFCIQVEKQYCEFMKLEAQVFSANYSLQQRADYSVRFAEANGVHSDDIIHNEKELDAIFRKR